MHPTSNAFSFDNPATLLFDPRPWRVSRDATDDGEISMLLPPDVHGFYFTEKKWRRTYFNSSQNDTNSSHSSQILVDGICPVKWNKKRVQ